MSKNSDVVHVSVRNATFGEGASGKTAEVVLSDGRIGKSTSAGYTGPFTSDEVTAQRQETRAISDAIKDAHSKDVPKR